MSRPSSTPATPVAPSTPTLSDPSRRRELTTIILGSTAVIAGLALLWWKRRKDGNKKFSPLSPATPTAQATALMRYLVPKWHTAGKKTVGSYDEAFGEDQFAKYFLTPEQSERSKLPQFKEVARERIQNAVPGLVNFLWSRTRVLDSELYSILESKESFTQLIVLGAGYDTRAYRFRKALNAKSVRPFEVDMPPLQAKKVKAMKEIERQEGGDIGVKDVTFVPLDLSRPQNELIHVLKESGLNTRGVNVFIWEGVTTYLTPDAVESSLRFMHAVSGPNSRVLVTFVSSAVNHVPGSEQMRKDLAAKNEPHKFHPTVEQFSAILDRTGWDIERLFTPEVLEAEYMTPDEGKAWPAGHVVRVVRRSF